MGTQSSQISPEPGKQPLEKTKNISVPPGTMENTSVPSETIDNMSVPWEKIKNISVSPTGFVFDQKNGHSFSVNETGLDILHALVEGKDLATIKQTLQLNYKVLPETVDAGLNNFISQLNRHLL